MCGEQKLLIGGCHNLFSDFGEMNYRETPKLNCLSYLNFSYLNKGRQLNKLSILAQNAKILA